MEHQQRIRHLIAVHAGHLHDSVKGVCDLVIEKRRVVGYGLLSGIAHDTKVLRSALSTGEYMFTVFLGGHVDEWKTLEVAQEEGVMSPTGVVVTLNDARAWAKLRTYRNLRFVYNASGQHFNRLAEFFPELGGDCLGDTTLLRVARLIDDRARDEFSDPPRQRGFVAISSPYAA